MATPAIEDSIHFSVVYLQANRAISFLGQLFSKNRFVNFVNDPYLKSYLITDSRLIEKIKCLHEMVEK